MTPKSESQLTQLGRESSIPSRPEDAPLEWVANPHPDRVYLVRFTCPEFTSICPVTGQPDFAHLVIDYVPHERLVESKSLKLFLAAQSRRLPRGLHADRRAAARGSDRAGLAAHRWLLVSARRHTDRRLLSVRQATRQPVAARTRRRALSRTSLTLVRVGLARARGMGRVMDRGGVGVRSFA